MLLLILQCASVPKHVDVCMCHIVICSKSKHPLQDDVAFVPIADSYTTVLEGEDWMLMLFVCAIFADR